MPFWRQEVFISLSFSLKLLYYLQFLVSAWFSCLVLNYWTTFYEIVPQIISTLIARCFSHFHTCHKKKIILRVPRETLWDFRFIKDSIPFCYLITSQTDERVLKRDFLVLEQRYFIASWNSVYLIRSWVVVGPNSRWYLNRIKFAVS